MYFLCSTPIREKFFSLVRFRFCVPLHSCFCVPLHSLNYVKPTVSEAVTRSNSASGICLNDIKQLIVNSLKDIISTVNEKFEPLNSKLTILTSRIQNIEEKMVSVTEIGKRNEEEMDELKHGLAKVAMELPGEMLNEVEERSLYILSDKKCARCNVTAIASWRLSLTSSCVRTVSFGQPAVS